MKTYKQLVAGDVRQKGDEVAGYGLKGTQYAHYNEIHCPNTNPNPKIIWTDWEPVNLIGELILASDVMAARFRRPQ